MDKTNENYFSVLNAVNVNEHTEKKNGLTYLSWAWAWGEIKKRFPDATYTVYEGEGGRIYWTDGKTAWVKTGVTVNGIEHIEYLPVMDLRNKSILVKDITSFDVNKAIQRSLTKACARHGLGLYIYAGEDLPEDLEAAEKAAAEIEKQKTIYVKSINQLLSDTNTGGMEMLDFANKKFQTKTQAFTEFDVQQLIWIIQKLETKKEKMSKQ